MSTNSTSAERGKAALAGGGENQPGVKGATVAAREARRASERDLSPENEAVVPSMLDIGGYLSDPTARAFIRDGKGTGANKVAVTLEADPAEEAAEEAATEEPEEGASGAETGEADADETADEETEEGEESPEEDPEAEKGKTQWPASAQKRVDELTKAKYERDEKISAQEAELNQLRAAANAVPVRIASTPANPLAGALTENDVERAVNRAQAIEQWAIKNPEGAEVVTDQEKGTTEFISPEKMREHLAAARQVINAAPERRQWIATNAQIQAEASEAYPEIFKPGTPENAQYLRVAKAVPELQRFANFPMIIADALAGQKARLAAGKGSGASKVPTPVKKPKVAPLSAKPAPRAPSKVIATAEAKKDLAKGLGSKRDVERYAESLIG